MNDHKASLELIILIYINLTLSCLQSLFQNRASKEPFLFTSRKQSHQTVPSKNEQHRWTTGMEK